MAAFVQYRSLGKPVVVTADPTCCSGSRATVLNGTGGRRLPTFHTNSAYSILNADKKTNTTNSQIRSAAKLARANMQDRDSASQIIASRVINSRYFLSAKTIACYLPMHDEVDTAAIFLRSWRAKKRIFAPVIDSQGTMKFREILPNSPLVQNFFGLWEPTIGEEISPRKLDTVITPLVAFDQQLNRIGMGGGYYDRCFAFLKHRKNCRRPKLIGTAFACQETANIAPNPWDIPLYRIITEAG